MYLCVAIVDLPVCSRHISSPMMSRPPMRRRLLLMLLLLPLCGRLDIQDMLLPGTRSGFSRTAAFCMCGACEYVEMLERKGTRLYVIIGIRRCSI